MLDPLRASSKSSVEFVEFSWSMNKRDVVPSSNLTGDSPDLQGRQ